MKMYRIYNPTNLLTPQVVQNLNNGYFLPFDPANVDFQQYQQWLSEGNVPEPADEPTLS